MKNSEYWRGRFSLLEHSTYKTAQTTLKEIEALYRQALYRTQKDIASWCTRIADDNGLFLTEARRLLGTKELEEFRWDVEQYIETAQKAGLDETWQKQLHNVSAKVHISRLEAVETQIRQQIEELYAGQEAQLTNAVRRAAENAYTGTLREAARGLDLNFQTVSFDKEQLDALTSKAWTTDDRTFRDRCWTNKTALVQTVHKGMTQSLLRGDSPAKLTDAIAKQFDVDRYKAGRLVYTETAYYSALAEKQGYKDLGVEKVEIIGTLDGSTCSICGQLDGREIPLAQYEPGVTVPPFHPRCRCTTAPVVPEDFADGLRIARGEDGEQYYVPEGTKWKEWSETNKRESSSSDVDFMGKAKKFSDRAGKLSIKAYQVDGHEGLFTQTNTRDAQSTVKLILAQSKELPQLQNVSAVVVAKDIPGIAAYDHVDNRLYVNERLSNAEYIKEQLSGGYFVAETAEDVLKHEMHHKDHWDCINAKALTSGKSSDIVKQEIETDLREYVQNQLSSDPAYIRKMVSRNAANGFQRYASLNELIADALLQKDKGTEQDSVLLKLVGGVLNDDSNV